MLNNDIRTSGTGHYKQNRGGAALTTGAVLGVVKNNIDPTHSGMIDVYIAAFGGSNPDDPDSWRRGLRPIRPWSGSGGSGDPRSGGDKAGTGNFINNPQSYGFASGSPEVGTVVLCLFIEGKPDQGYYIGTAPEVGLQHNIPAVAAAATTVIPNSREADLYGGATRLPTGEVNFANPSIERSPAINSEAKPVHSEQAAILSKQGLVRDNIRGVISSSAQRQTPSTVFGFSTQGRPIYQGGYTDQSINEAINANTDPTKFQVIGRTGGHSLVLDDGTIDGQDQLVRLRTATGHQILMSDSGQTLFIIHANGESWIELGKEGTIDMYATNSVNIRTKGDLNLHADRDVNINATRNLNVYGEKTVIESGGATTHRVGGSYVIETEGNYTVKAAGAASIDGGKLASLSGTIAYITGKPLMMNSGASPVKPQKVTPMTKISHKDSSFSTIVGWVPESDKPLLSIASRVPAHMPWSASGAGVDIKVDQVAASSGVGSSAESTLPIQTQSLVAAAGTVPSGPLTDASLYTAGPKMSSVTGAGGISFLNSDTTQAMMSQNLASFTVPDLQPKNLIPNTGITFPMAASAGPFSILKPGADALAAARIAAGIPAKLVASASNFSVSAISSVGDIDLQRQGQIFAYRAGVESSKLVNSGIINAEAPSTANAGIINAATLHGAESVVALVAATKTVNPGELSAILAGSDSARGFFSKIAKIVGGIGLGAVTGGLMSSIAGGNFASGLVDKVSSGIMGKLSSTIGGVLSSVNNLFNKISSFSLSNLVNSLKSQAQSAFKSVENSFTKLTANKPNTLSGDTIDTSVPELLKLSQMRDSAIATEEYSRREYDNYRLAYTQDPNTENSSLLQQAKNKLDLATQRRAQAESDLTSYNENYSSGATNVTNSATKLVNGMPSVMRVTNTVGKLVDNITNPAALLNKLSGNLLGKVSSLAGGVLKSVDSFTKNLSGALSGLSSMGSKVRSAVSAVDTVNNAKINTPLASAVHSSAPQIPIPKSISNSTVPVTTDPNTAQQNQTALRKEIDRLRLELNKAEAEPQSDGMGVYNRDVKQDKLKKQFDEAVLEYNRMTGGS
jgi:hypothetical protein